MLSNACAKDYTSGWLAREAKRRAEIRRLREHLESRLHALREVFRRYDVKEAYLFGSFASGRLRPGSDLDIAVRGASSSTWYRMSAEIERAARLNLDLLDLDLAPVDLSERILSSGRRIFP